MNIEAEIEKFIFEELLFGKDQAKFDPDQSLVQSGIIDSLALLRLMSFLEERFGFTIEEDEVVPDNFETLNIIRAFVESKL